MAWAPPQQHYIIFDIVNKPSAPQIFFFRRNSFSARLAPARVSSRRACLGHFRLGHHIAVGTCCRLLGVMASASPALPLGLLHMRPFLWSAERIAQLPLCSLEVEMPSIFASRSQDGRGLQPSGYYDVRLPDWLGCCLRGQTDLKWPTLTNTNCLDYLELRAISLALDHFLPALTSCHVIVRMDNMAVVSHINCQGGWNSCRLSLQPERLRLLRVFTSRLSSHVGSQKRSP